MVNINITLPDDLHTSLKLAAALSNKSLRDYVEESLAHPLDDISDLKR